jgi:glycosyltransferase involved in cell wall biosynthesis
MPVPASRGERPFRVICYGRISRPRKGTRLVAEAAGSLAGGRRGIELHLFDSYTTGPVDPRIGFDPGFPCRFYLNLPQEGMAAMYGAADLFVSAERRAGWSNTAAEAAACGLPLVCTKSGTGDFAIDGRNAIVIPRRDGSLLRKAMKRICDEPGLGEAMGRESAEIMKAFTWEKVCDRMERDFRKLLDGYGPAPGPGSPGGE